MSAARIEMLLDFFTVKTQQIGADIVDFIDIIAIFFETVNQPGADFFPFRSFEVGLKHLNEIIKTHSLLLEHHSLERMQRVAEVGDTNALHAGEVIARSALGDIFTAFNTVQNKRGEQGNRRLVAMADIANIAAVNHQLDVVANFFADLVEQPVPAHVRIAFILQDYDLHNLEQVKHRNIVQSVSPPGDRQLNAADDGVVASILERYPAIQKRRNHDFIIKDLRDTCPKADRFRGLAQERTVDQLIDTNAKVRLR